jgi:hypothetical protein
VRDGNRSDSVETPGRLKSVWPFGGEGYPFNAGHSAASMTYRNSLTALSGHGQRVKLR